MIKKMDKNRKMPTQREMLEQLRNGKIVLSPLSFRLLETEPTMLDNRRLDASIEVTWEDKSARFAVECKASSTPKSFQAGINQLKTISLPEGILPLLFVPYLSEKQILTLEQEGISGIDMCGNGIVVVPGKLFVIRGGEKNRFSSSSPIKNIYRKNSSMVGRVFLLRSSYNSVQDILLEINRRNLLVDKWDKSPISFPTVSKALKVLEDDLIVGRNNTIRLLQPDKLLERLSSNYQPPNVRGRVSIKVEQGGVELLRKLSKKQGMSAIATGTSSVSRYATMQRGDVLSVYSPRIEKLLDNLPGSRNDRFPNLELIETEDETVYFDAREEKDFWWASPVQTYLELMAGDKRDRETAEQVKSFLLSSSKQAQR